MTATQSAPEIIDATSGPNGEPAQLTPEAADEGLVIVLRRELVESYDVPPRRAEADAATVTGRDFTITAALR